jgi:hypothetical protein
MAMHEVLADFGKQIGMADLAFDEGGHCVLAIDTTIVNMEYDEQSEFLLVYALIGRPAGNLGATYEAILRANFPGMGSNGAIFSLRPDDGGVVLSRPISTAALDPVGFGEVLESFVATAEDWTGRLQELGTAAAPNHAAPPPFTGVRG